MKKIVLSSLFALLLASGYAQPDPQRRPPPPPPREDQELGEKRRPHFGRGDTKQGKERIELFKIQFITKKLDLTKAEAETFWPVYEEHKKAVNEILQSKSKDEIVFQEAMLNARKKYKNDLKPVLKSDERVNNALKLEREFLRQMHFEMNRRRGF
jgi:hypothetical protein